MNEDKFSIYLSNISRERIEIRPHCYDKIFDRQYSEEWIFTCLLKQNPLKIIKQRVERFKLFYKHPDSSPRNNEYDLIIVVDIIQNSIKDIKIVTTYEQLASRRLRQK
jgi:hypothetical protein